MASGSIPRVPNAPTPSRRVDEALAASFIAHEAIFDMHRELVAGGQHRDTARELLAESAQITLEQLPRVTARARELNDRWGEKSVLDPRAAGETLTELEAEVERIEIELAAGLERLREIASRLRELLDG